MGCITFNFTKNDFAFLTQTILKSLIIIRNNRCTLVYLQTPLGEIKEVKAGTALHKIWGFSTPSDNIFAYVELDNNDNLFTLTHCLTDNKSWITNFFQLNCSKSRTLITGPESVTISTHSSPWPALCMAMVCWNPSMLEKVVGVDRALDTNSKVGLQHLPPPKVFFIPQMLRTHYRVVCYRRADQAISERPSPCWSLSGQLALSSHLPWLKYCQGKRN